MNGRRAADSLPRIRSTPAIMIYAAIQGAISPAPYLLARYGIRSSSSRCCRRPRHGRPPAERSCRHRHDARRLRPKWPSRHPRRSRRRNAHDPTPDGGDHSLMRRCSGFQQLVSGIEGALQIKFDLGDAFRRAVLATTARSGVNDKRDAGFAARQFSGHRRNGGCGHIVSLSGVRWMC